MIYFRPEFNEGQERCPCVDASTQPFVRFDVQLNAANLPILQSAQRRFRFTSQGRLHAFNRKPRRQMTNQLHVDGRGQISVQEVMMSLQ